MGEGSAMASPHFFFWRLQQPAATPRSKWSLMRCSPDGVVAWTSCRLSTMTPQGASTGWVDTHPEIAIPNVRDQQRSIVDRFGGASRLFRFEFIGLLHLFEGFASPWRISSWR